jgi:hypothetical protein
VFRKTVLGIFLIAALGGIFLSQQFLIAQKAVFEADLIQMKKPVNGKLLKPFLFGHEAFYADLF